MKNIDEIINEIIGEDFDNDKYDIEILLKMSFDDFEYICLII